MRSKIKLERNVEPSLRETQFRNMRDTKSLENDRKKEKRLRREREKEEKD